MSRYAARFWPGNMPKGLRPGALAVSATLMVGFGGTIRSRYASKAACEEGTNDKRRPQESTMDSWLSFDSVKSQFSALSARLTQISSELSGEPGSLFYEIVEDSVRNQEINPELGWKASVRLGTDIGFWEKAYLSQRKRFMRQAFAALMGVDESTVRPLMHARVSLSAASERNLIEKKPFRLTSVIFPSWGWQRRVEVRRRDSKHICLTLKADHFYDIIGYRAMTSTTGCLLGAHRSGILDVISYISGISGSCWALSSWYSVTAGDLHRLRNHIKSRITTPFLDLGNFALFTDPPTNKVRASHCLVHLSRALMHSNVSVSPMQYLLSGPVVKLASKGGTTSLVDIYVRSTVLYISRV